MAVWPFNSPCWASRVTLTVRGRRTKQGKFDWENALVDAGILSGMTFFTGLSALAASHAISAEGLLALGCAVGLEFLGFLAAKRKLISRDC